MKDIGKRLFVCCFPLAVKENNILDIVYEPLRREGIVLSNYNWFLSNFRRTDIFHVHWPDAVVMGTSRFRILIKFIAFLSTVLIFRTRRIPIIYSVHNIGSHEGNHPFLEGCLWRMFLPHVSVFVHMNSESVKALKAWRPNLCDYVHEVIPHPYYTSKYEEKRSRVHARKELNLPPSGFMVLSFGLIRPYKGIEDLIAAFRVLQDPNALLLIIGRVTDSTYEKFLLDARAGDSRIRFDFRFVSEDELDAFLCACDVVAITHRKLNNSGVAMMALSRGRRLLAPARGSLIDLEREIGQRWITLFIDDQIEDALLVAQRVGNELPEGEVPDLAFFAPDKLGARLANLFWEVHDANGRRDVQSQ